MEEEYDQSDQQFDAQDCDPQEFNPRRRNFTKNQQIYGDFEEAYEQEPNMNLQRDPFSYGQFKAGTTIESYSSEVEVNLPKSKPKLKQVKKVIEEDEDDEKPMLGQFTLNSFLNQLGGGQELNEIAEQQNEDSSNLMPEGLNQKIINHLQLVKIGEEETEEQLDLEKLTFDRYMRLGKPAPPKAEPKYKTQEEKDLAKEFTESYGIGFKMMQKIGFKNITKGLGKNQTGRHTPVEALHKTAFTMKDEDRNHKKLNKSESEAEQQVEQKQISIPQQLFSFRSKNHKINNFLLDLQKDYQRYSSQIYFLENEVQSMKNKLQITLSTQCQEQRETDQLKSEIEKLEIIGGDIDRCAEFPHLGQYYQIDLLFVKKVYDKFRNNDFDFLHKNAEKELRSLKSALFKFYLAKSKETMKMFQQTTAIEERIHKNFSKKNKKKKESDVIDLDHISQDEVEVVTIGVDEQQKIKKFIDLLINKGLVPHVESMLNQADSLDRIRDERIIDLMDVVNRFDDKQLVNRKIVLDRVFPLYENYLNRMNLDDLQAEKGKVLPHMVILPWLHLLKLHPNFTFMKFYKTLARKLWSIQNSVLYNMVSPLLKFSSAKDVNFFINLYLAPRMLYQLQSFSIGSPNVALLNGFTKYCEFLNEEVKGQILENTLFLEVEQVYRKYIQEKEKGQVLKWLKVWKKFSQKISPGLFDRFFQSKIEVK